jgi:hypothetical protein
MKKKMVLWESQEILGCNAQSIGNTIHPLLRAGRLECHQNPEHRRIRLWCLPGRLERTPPIMAPQVVPKSLPLPTTISQELNKLKATPEAQGTGIDDDDLLWQARYRAAASARKLFSGQHHPADLKPNLRES